MMLCPQAWPISGRASYSARTAMVRPLPEPGVAFLGRGAQQQDGAGHGVRVGLIEGMQGEEGADSCGGDDVVSAGVADLGQGVVFGQNGDGAAVAGAGRRSQSGLDSVQSRVD